MTPGRRVLLRWTAAFCWVVSLFVLFRAVGLATAGEQAAFAPAMSPEMVAAIKAVDATANHWAAVGWMLQAATALLFAASLSAGRVVRRVFVALGVLIGADGVVMLVVAVLVR